MKPTSQLTLFVFLFLQPLFSFSQEICNNNIDDDGDRLIDLYDLEDCPCSVIDTFNISMIPNPSFENLNCIPTYYSQLNCAEEWNQATFATSDLFVPGGYFPDFVPMPIPSGNNCVGTLFDFEYLEYIGTCLNGPMLSEQSYVLNFYAAAGFYDDLTDVDEIDPNVPPVQIDLVMYGSTICEPFPLNSGPCWDDNGWIELGRISYTLKHEWTKESIFFIPPQDIYSIILGGSCSENPLKPIGGGAYIFWDNLQLKKSSKEIIYYVPNTFTPNGDEHNNIFNPVFVCGYDPLEYRFEIYDRWGEIVFTSLDAAKGWDGTYHGAPAKEGVFGWKLEYKAANTSEKKVLAGHANLLR